MGKKKKKSNSVKLAKKLQRTLAMQQGFYDGRFRVRKVKDKKKEASKNWARKKTSFSDQE